MIIKVFIKKVPKALSKQNNVIKILIAVNTIPTQIEYIPCVIIKIRKKFKNNKP